MLTLLATYPTFWDVVWWMIIFFVWVIWIYVVIRVFIDNFERRDHGGWAKAMWTQTGADGCATEGARSSCGNSLGID